MTVGGTKALGSPPGIAYADATHADNDVQDGISTMLDASTASTTFTMDNYAELLALAGLADTTGRCIACGEDAPPVPTDHLWMLHHPDAGESAPTSLLCSHA